MTRGALKGTDRLRLAEDVIRLAWLELPPDNRTLLESVGVTQHEVVAEPLGLVLDRFLASAGEPRLTPIGRDDLNLAVGAWSQRLRIVLLNAAHPALAGLDDASYEAILARAAWHEWGHALSLTRASDEDVAKGEAYLQRAPIGIAEFIRSEGYRSREFTHELVAECYAMLMSRRRRGQAGKPNWLADEIYELIRRVTGWHG